VSPSPAALTAEQLLVGILASAITALGEAGVRERGMVGRSALESAAKQASARLCDVEEIREDLGGERLRAFLGSAEMTQFARQVFAIRVDARAAATQAPGPTQAEVEASFVRSLKLRTGVTDEVARLDGGRLFASFVDACEDALEGLVRRGSLDAADVRAGLNSRRILEELGNLRRLLEMDGARSEPDLVAISEFEVSYRRQVIEDHAVIALPSLDSHHLRRVEDVYVKPTLDTGPSSDPLAYDDLFPLDGNTVVLGDPGGGKSTLIARMAVDVADGASGSHLTPIVVVLRDYAAEKGRSSCSIVDFMTLRATGRYQFNRADVPGEAFEYLLRSQRAIVFFDGLDELTQVADRRGVAGDIEAFRRIYPTVVTVVTSRRIGYEEAPLRPEFHRRLGLAALDDPQVEEYARLALNSHPAVAPEQRRFLREAFMDRSGTLGELRGNPLLLGLLLERFVKTRELPAHKVQVIESCALLLFERWDGDRDIAVRFPFASKLRPIVARIAHEIYGDPELEEGVSEGWLIDRTVEYLLGRRYEDADEAGGEAREFIALCRGRTWVFSAVGATAVEELYAFTHRIFMEYFVAVFLVRGCETTSELVDIVRPRIEEQEWDEVCQTAVYLGTDRDGGPDALLELLVPSPEELGERTAINRLSFCTRVLAIVVPDRLETIEGFLESWIGALSAAEASAAVPELVSALVNSHPENQSTLARAFPDRVLVAVTGWPRPDSMVWLLQSALSLTRRLSPYAENESLEIWSAAERQVAAGGAELIGDLAHVHPAIARLALVHDVLDLEAYLGAQGAGAIFVDPGLPPGPGSPERLPVGAVAENILAGTAESAQRTPFRARGPEWARRQLGDFGRWAESRIPAQGRLQPPWTPPTAARSGGPSMLDWLKLVRPIPIDDWDREEIFGATCLVLGLAEHRGANRISSHRRQRAATADTFLDLVGPLLLARDDPGHSPGLAPLAEHLSGPQMEVMVRWAARGLSLTR
jgi:hypothetical protein